MVSVADEEGFFRAVVATFQLSRSKPGPQLEALTSRVTTLFEQYVKLSQNLNYETMIAAIRVDDPGKLADTVGANLQLTIEEKQELLEIFDPIDRLTRVAEMLDIEIEKLNVDRTIQGRVKRQMERAQKEYYLNEKIKAIQKELGRGEKSEFDELKKKIEAAGMTKDAQEKAMAELKRLEQMPPMSAESTVSRNYLDWLLAVPWKKKTKEIRDLQVRRKGARIRSLRSREDQGAHPRVPRRAAAGEESARARFSASSGLRASARPRSACRSRRRPAASSSACRSAACATKPRFAATAAPISARCPARSSR